MVHYSFLLTYWISLWYTFIFYWPTGYLYITLLSTIDPVAISMVHSYFLVAHWISLVHYHLLFAHMLSLWYTTLSYWPTDYPYATILSSTGQMAISMVHNPLLLAHWISLWNTAIFYWPIGYLYGTLCSHNGPLAISMVH